MAQKPTLFTIFWSERASTSVWVKLTQKLNRNTGEMLHSPREVAQCTGDAGSDHPWDEEAM
jgi:hypothetical protein